MIESGRDRLATGSGKRADEVARERLNDRLARLSEQIARREDDARQPLQQDSEDQAIEREGEETSAAIEHAALVEAMLVRQALARLEAGEYGFCTTCGRAIDKRRLEVMPAARECITCAGRAH